MCFDILRKKLLYSFESKIETLNGMCESPYTDIVNSTLGIVANCFNGYASRTFNLCLVVDNFNSFACVFYAEIVEHYSVCTTVREGFVEFFEISYLYFYF